VYSVFICVCMHAWCVTVLGMGSRALCVLHRSSTTELHPPSLYLILIN
jgi:hypothetical protein